VSRIGQVQTQSRDAEDRLGETRAKARLVELARALEYRLQFSDEEARQCARRSIEAMIELDELPARRDLVVILVELLDQDRLAMVEARRARSVEPRPLPIQSEEQEIGGRRRRVIWLVGPMKKQILEAFL